MFKVDPEPNPSTEAILIWFKKKNKFRPKFQSLSLPSYSIKKKKVNEIIVKQPYEGLKTHFVAEMTLFWVWVYIST